MPTRLPGVLMPLLALALLLGCASPAKTERQTKTFIELLDFDDHCSVRGGLNELGFVMSSFDNVPTTACSLRDADGVIGRLYGERGKVQKGLAHYRSGKHPYTRFRHLLVMADSPKWDGSPVTWLSGHSESGVNFEKRSTDPSRSTSKTSEPVRVAFRVPPDTSRVVGDKIHFDFVLSQAFGNGLFAQAKKQNAATTSQDTKSAADLDSGGLSLMGTSPDFELIRHLHEQRHLVREAAAHASSGDTSLFLHETEPLFFKAIDEAFGGAAYSPSLIESAKRLPNSEEKTELLTRMIFFLPLGDNQELLRTLIEALPAEERHFYEPLLRFTKKSP